MHAAPGRLSCGHGYTGACLCACIRYDVPTTYFSLAHGSTGAITEDGKLLMWGRGEHGRLGTGNQANHLVPKHVDLRQRAKATLSAAQVSLAAGK